MEIVESQNGNCYLEIEIVESQNGDCLISKWKLSNRQNRECNLKLEITLKRRYKDWRFGDRQLHLETNHETSDLQSLKY